MREITDEVKKVIIGKDEVVDMVFAAILAQGHVLMEDVPGVGKTTLAVAFSKALGLETKRIQFTPDTVASDITGYTAFDRQAQGFTFHSGAAMTNILLADEINRTSGKTQSALLEVMEERACTVDGRTYPLPEPFAVIATQNPTGTVGTAALPVSQLDRFMIKLSMGYPDKEAMRSIMSDRSSSDPLADVKAVCTAEKLIEMQKKAKARLAVEDEDALREAVRKRRQATADAESQHNSKELHEGEKRLAQLETLISKTYEEKLLGTVPEELCVKMLNQYLDEQKMLREKVAVLKEKCETAEQAEKDIDRYIENIKKYVDIQELTRETCLELIEYIVIGDRPESKDEDRQIHIFYKFLDKGLTEKRNILLPQNVE